MSRAEAFYLVWNPEGMNPRVRHDSFGRAAEEAKRLALTNPGKEFFVMQAHRRVTIHNPLVIEDFDTGLDVPF